ncbi:MAG: CDP-alcohol phosphatidyltransferase family protein [Bacteroidales bacterium]|nr:CDP-alcohol phosphatidyltransferase family protein [Bacteroidales bacterium]
MINNIKQAERIQTSVTNRLERKTLIWLARHQPSWVTSDMLTILGSMGAFLVGLGFFLTRYGIDWLWLSSVGLVINWYGDSLDGTLARVRNCQRPIYGYYIDHTVDCINEAFMFIGAGLSPLVNLNLALAVFILYLFMTINVSINAHLKSEFRLTYAKLGPTEFRILIFLANTILIAFPRLVTLRVSLCSCSLTLLDLLASILAILLAIIYITVVIGDAHKYAVADPKKPRN